MDIGVVHGCYWGHSDGAKNGKGDDYWGKTNRKPKTRFKEHNQENKGGARRTSRMPGDLVQLLWVTRFMNVCDNMMFEYALDRFVWKRPGKVGRRRVPWKCPDEDWLRQVDKDQPKRGSILRGLAFLDAVFQHREWKPTKKALSLGDPLRRGPDGYVDGGKFRVFVLDHPLTRDWRPSGGDSLAVFELGATMEQIEEHRCQVVKQEKRLVFAASKRAAKGQVDDE